MDSQNNPKQMGTYEIIVKCCNCGFRGTIEIPQGRAVGWKACPVCGCHMLTKR